MDASEQQQRLVGPPSGQEGGVGMSEAELARLDAEWTLQANRINQQIRQLRETAHRLSEQTTGNRLWNKHWRRRWKQLQFALYGITGGLIHAQTLAEQQRDPYRREAI